MAGILKNKALQKLNDSDDPNTMLLRRACLEDPKHGLSQKYFLDRMHQCDGKAVQKCGMKGPSKAYMNLVERSISTALYCMKGMFENKDVNNAITKKVIKVDPRLPKAEVAPPMAWNDQHGLKAELLLGMLNVESGYQVGARSDTGALGMGQVIGDARKHISEVIKRDNIPGKLRAMKNKSCTALAEQLEQSNGTMQNDSPCDAISIEKGNPLLNLVYSFVNVANNEKQVRDFINKNTTGNVGKLINGLGAEDREQVIFGLAVWAHNTGARGMTESLKVLDNNSMFMMDAQGKANKESTYQTIGELLQDCRVNGNAPGCVQLEAKPKETGWAAQQRVINSVGQSVGSYHLFKEAAKKDGNMNRFKEAMGYFPKILESAKWNRSNGCLDYYGNGATRKGQPGYQGQQLLNGGTDGN